MPKFVPSPSFSLTTTWVQPFGTTSRNDANAVWVHSVGNFYFNTTNADAGMGYLSAGTYNFGPIDPSTLWLKGVGTNTASGYLVTQ